MAYAATSTLGASFLNINGDGGAPQVVESDMVSSMNGEYANMRQVGYKTGVCASTMCRNVCADRIRL